MMQVSCKMCEGNTNSSRPCAPTLDAYRKVAADAELLKQMELWRLLAARGVQQLCHLVAELEGSRLKAQIPSWGDLEDEPAFSTSLLLILLTRESSFPYQHSFMKIKTLSIPPLYVN